LEGSKFGEFADVICYNCGTLEHHKANCKKLRVCFICREESHVVENCPIRKEGHKCAKYIGSATAGLGFYQIEIPKGTGKSTIDFTKLWQSLCIDRGHHKGGVAIRVGHMFQLQLALAN
jgi:hypothetical protein